MNKNKKLPKNLINHKVIDYVEGVEAQNISLNEPIPEEFSVDKEPLNLVSSDLFKTEDKQEELSDTNIINDMYQEFSDTDTKNDMNQELSFLQKEKTKEKKGFWKQFKTEIEIRLDESTELEVLKEEKEMSIRKNTENTNEAAVISSTMSVKGDVELDTSLVLNGKIYGNVKCKDLIEATFGSYIEGNIVAQSVKLNGSELKGNISVEDYFEANNQSKVQGNIIAKRVEISGHVDGEINASDSLVLKNTAVVKGDLFSASISIEAGAQLEGKVTTLIESSKKVNLDN
jgi:cytoskeletal protein CcmA (bactofilin family)